MSTPNPQLRGVQVRGTRMRSANVEHDAKASLHGYILTGRGLEMTRRVLDSHQDTTATRAFAVTGPYGSGKSSVALMLTALLCRTDEPHEQAITLLSARDAALADRAAHLTKTSPILRAAATARKEPVTATVSRALRLASLSDEQMRKALEQGQGELTSREILELVTAVTDRRPMLLIIDEFGKNLEYFTQDPQGGDVFLLQELAELAAGTRTRHPLTLITFQHAPYGDYLAATDSLHRREWSKVQGRFIDVSFTEDPADVAALVRGTIEQHLTRPAKAALAAYATAAHSQWEYLGLSSILASDESLWTDTYPLHPAVLAGLPQLCATLGQHDRTLAGFLTGDEEHTLARFLQQHPTRSAPATLGTLRLDTVYDYFDATVAARSGRFASRWLEVTSRVESARELSDLDQDDIALIKTVGLLNIIGSGGALRASAGVLALALADPQDVTVAHHESVHARCERLVERSFLTYRRHDDEYRVWAGTDIDIDARVGELVAQLSAAEICSYMSTEYLPPAVVAGRHSQEHGTLRHFQPVVHSSGTALPPPTPGTSPDGMLVYHLEDAVPTPNAIPDPPSVPLLIGSSSDAATVRAAANEALALGELVLATDLDPVARAEVRDRLGSAKTALASAFTAAFDPAGGHATWVLLEPGSDTEQPMGSAPSMSALVSAACDIAYHQSPRIRSEMLGRHQLTSQGAKARREVLDALIANTSFEQAGLSGHGPEVAIYRGVIAHLQLHGPLSRGGKSHGWTEPSAGSPGNAAPAFRHLRHLIDQSEEPVNVADLATAMAAPPFGIKAGLFPLLLTAVIGNDPDIAIFEEGTFQSLLSPELSERMIKGPIRFHLRHIPTGQGQGAQLIDALTEVLGIAGLKVRARTRNPGMVLIAAAVLGQYRNLSPYAQRTTHISAAAIALRTALAQGRDPGQLVLHDLPTAVGADPILATDPASPRLAQEIALAIRAALVELTSADQQLTERIVRDLGECLNRPQTDPSDVRDGLAQLGHGITSLPTEPTLRSMVHHVRQDGLDDDEWFAQAGMIITGQPPTQWRQEHLDNFTPQARNLTRAMQRLHALHVEDHHNAQSRRLTLTGSDGTEEHLVLRGGEEDPDVDALLDTWLAQARADLGPQAELRLLGALAARTLTPTP